MANEGVVVPLILEDGIGTCIPLNPFFEVGKEGENWSLLWRWMQLILKLVGVVYDSDASEDTVDCGVVGDPNMEGV